MSVDTTPEQRDQDAVEAPAKQQPPGARPPGQSIGASLRQIQWRETLLIALLMAIGWCVFFLGGNILQILAGIVPVMAGLYLGRRVKHDWLGHGLALGFSGFAFGMLIIVVYGLLGEAGVVPLPTLTTDPDAAPLGLGGLLVNYGLLMAFSLIPFPAFGTVMAGRSEQRNQQLKQEVAERGGRLERPGVVRTVEDLRGLSLPQLGSYVLNLYRKQGFTFTDYRFIDKDRHLDIELTYEDQPYILRLTVADRVTPGTLQSLVQDMKRRDVRKGVVITSTEFTPDAAKAGKDRRNVVLIDGQTLFEIAEK